MITTKITKAYIITINNTYKKKLYLLIENILEKYNIII